jgi:hypothetical protein
MSSARRRRGTTSTSTPWEIAKALLINDIRDGKLPPTMSPKVAYSMKVEYKNVEYCHFRTNLNSLRKSLKVINDRAIADKAAVSHDQEQLLVHQDLMRTRTIANPHHWDMSEAQRFLKLDVDDGKHCTMLPKELRMTREEYKAFPLDVFRKHIHQEVRSRKETAYWQVRTRKSQEAGEKSKTIQLRRKSTAIGSSIATSPST